MTKIFPSAQNARRNQASSVKVTAQPARSWKECAGAKEPKMIGAHAFITFQRRTK